MNQVPQIALNDRNSARALDLSTDKFLKLVDMGALPPPVKLPDGTERWRVSDLHAILDGSAAKPDEDFEL